MDLEHNAAPEGKDVPPQQSTLMGHVKGTQELRERAPRGHRGDELSNKINKVVLDGNPIGNKYPLFHTDRNK